MSKFNMRLSMFKSFIKLTGGDYLPQLSSLGSNHLFLALCLIFISLGKNERAVAQQLNFGLLRKFRILNTPFKHPLVKPRNR